MNKQEPENLRLAIDRIALQVSEEDNENDLQEAIADRTSAHIAQLLRRGVLTLTDEEKVTKAIIRGVLQRLEQMAISGGKVGTA